MRSQALTFLLELLLRHLNPDLCASRVLSSFGLCETPPAVVPGMPPGKGLGKGFPRVDGRYRMLLNVDLQPVAGGAGVTVTALLSDEGAAWLAH